MYSFVLVAGGAGGERTRATLQRVARGQERVMPMGGATLRTQLTLLPEIDGGLLRLSPEGGEPGLLDEVVDSRLRVIAYGEVYGEARPALAIRDAYLRGGVSAVRLLDGCFSACVIERAEHRLVVCSDLLGHRGLRTLTVGDALYLSPHDIPLVSTGHCPTDVDPCSALSAAAWDWSLNGRSMIAAIEPWEPAGFLEWRGGELARRVQDLWFPADRIDPRDRGGIARQVQQVAACMASAAQRFGRSQSEIRMALTAGMDSRAVLALLLRSVGPERILASTSGQPNAMDVVVARQLAELVGVRHAIDRPVASTGDEFGAHAKMRAFYANGDTNAKRAVSRCPRWAPQPAHRVGGIGGEIYRGYYYKYFGLRAAMPDDPGELARTLHNAKAAKRLRVLGLDPSSEACRQLAARLQDTFQMQSTLSSNGADNVDLFYLRERFGQWGATSQRSLWARSWTPFTNVEAIRAALRLPPAVGEYCNIHGVLLRSLPLRAYLVPINRKHTSLALRSGPAWSRMRNASAAAAVSLAKHLPAASALAGSLPRRLGRAQDRATIEGSRKGAFRNELRESVAELMLSTHSVSCEVLGRKATETLLKRYDAGEDLLQPIGALITAEVFMGLVRDARALC